MIRKLTISTASILVLMALAFSALFFAAPSFAQEDATEEQSGRGANSVLSDYISEEDVAAARANAFGMTVAEMEAAKEAAQSAKEAAKADAVSAAVADGALTQEQADQILSGEGRNRRAARVLRDYISHDDVEAAIAAAYGMSVEELDAAKTAAKEAVQALRSDAIDAALADGAITEEQAERMRSHEGRGCRGGQRNGAPTAPVVETEA